MTEQPRPRRSLGEVRGAKRTLGPVRGSFNPAPRRGPFPATIPTCCTTHRSEVLDRVAYLTAVDAYNNIASAVDGNGCSGDQLDAIVDGYRQYMTARLEESIEVGRSMWLIREAKR